MVSTGVKKAVLSTPMIILIVESSGILGKIDVFQMVELIFSVQIN
jgi:hypothetical protein